mmetsp:Transcript_26879/g.58660  ORF Transcript_26879/g.58660 Transcript_26879/m.58660 type:complete len:465 (+) Transcript_26879:175-1569(+)
MATTTQSIVTWVVVLGDFGRSPRMQYHAQSLASKPGSVVYVIAYGGSKPILALMNANNVHMALVPEPSAFLRKLPRILALAIKVLQQMFWLAWVMLFRLPKPHSILMQNPPAIPTMALCWLAAWRHAAAWYIDWHNFGYTILALNQGGPRNWLVRMARQYELFWGKRGSKHFCVTKAMQRELADVWGVEATVLYDRPPAQFQRTSVAKAHKLFVRLSSDLNAPGYADFLSDEAQQWTTARTALTSSLQAAAGSTSSYDAVHRPDRPAIVVSSTSWTPDEDFGILLEAALRYEEAVEAEQRQGTPAGIGRLPRLLLLITGRGPQRDMYLQRVRALKLHHVAIRSLWLEPEDYPLLLGAADLGVSLHASSSGLDLPMKVVDMYGSGLPVCALAYSCIHELVADGKTGLLFQDSKQLCEQLQALLQGFPAKPTKLLQDIQQAVLQKESKLRWRDNWDAVAWPMLSRT